MVGEHYITTGVSVSPRGDLWSISLFYQDAGFCEDASTEGTLKLRYYVADLEKGVKTIVDDARRLGIKFWSHRDVEKIALYMDGDGEDANIEYPQGWEKLFDEIAERLPVYSIYSDLQTSGTGVVLI